MRRASWLSAVSFVFALTTTPAVAAELYTIDFPTPPFTSSVSFATPSRRDSTYGLAPSNGTGQLIVNNGATLQFGDGTSTGGSAVNSGTIFVNNTGTVAVNKTDGGTVSSAIASNPGATTTLSGNNANGTTNTFAATSFNNGGGFAVNSTNAGATLAFSGSSGAIVMTFNRPWARST